jgi:hypothetical protein
MQHGVPEADQLTVSAGVGNAALLMVPAVDSNNESQRGSREVRNVAPDRDLPAEGNAELIGPQLRPKQGL